MRDRHYQRLTALTDECDIPLRLQVAGFANESVFGNLNWPIVFVDMHVHNLGGRHIGYKLDIAWRVGYNANFDSDRGVADTLNLGVTRNEVAYLNWLLENDLVHRNCDHPSKPQAVGSDRPGLVDNAQNMTAKNCADCIGIAWHHHHANRRIFGEANRLCAA